MAAKNTAKPKNTKPKNATTKKAVTIPAKASSLACMRQKDTQHGVYVQWLTGKKGAFSKTKQTDHFEAEFEYADGTKMKGTKNFKYFPGGVVSATPEEAKGSKTGKYQYYEILWTAPDNAIRVRVHVKPVAQTYEKVTNKNKKNEKREQKPRYSSTYSAYVYRDFRTEDLPAPSLSVSDEEGTNTFFVTVSSDDPDARYADITPYNATNPSKPAVVSGKKLTNKELLNGSYSCKFSVPAGQEWYFVAVVKSSGKKATSPRSERAYARTKPPKPGKPNGKALSTSSAEVTWAASKGAESYTVDYLGIPTNENYVSGYFKTHPDLIKTQTDVHNTKLVLSNLDMGLKYFFRIKAVNAAGESGWSDAGPSGGVILGTVPDAPTTYDTEAAVLKEESPLRLRWTHNSEDESDQQKAEVKVTWGEDATTRTLEVAGGQKVSFDLEGAENEEIYDVVENYYLDLDLGMFDDGDEVTWKVRTKGAAAEWSPWSVERFFSVYERPSISCSLNADDADNKLTALPLEVEMDPSGGGDAVSGYHVAIQVAESTSYTDAYGDEVFVSAGEIVYETDYATSQDPFTASIGVEANLQPSTTYTVLAEASMQSGLRTQSEPMRFSVDFDGTVPEPSCAVSFDEDSLTANITPACYAVDEDGEVTNTLQEGVTLSVYRIDEDGSLILLDDNIPNVGSYELTDPHASFDECWYRVVATDTATGMSNFVDGYDDSPYSLCVIQWDETWNKLSEEDAEGDASYDYAGSRLDGLYNLDFSESASVQAEDIEYIGREHPVSYYGTQKGYTARYQTSFPKTDGGTLALVRKLMAWRDDVYIRESSGTGFWAHITNADLSRSAEGGAINFTISATRVDRTDNALRRE